MSYSDLEQACLFYGFGECPLSVSEYDHALAMGVPEDDLYGVACDVDNGWSLDEAIAAAIRNKGVEQ